MSFIMRTARADDLQTLYEMAKLTGGGFTNLPADLLRETFKTRNRLKVKIGLKILGGPVDSYSKCKPGEVGSLINSWDHLEIFCREDNASKTLKACVGTSVTVTNC